MVPLFTRIKRDEVLDQFVRGQIYGYIRANPGDIYSSIRDNLGLKNGVTTYHLDVLAREEYVYSEIDGTHRRFYPTGWEEEKRPYLSKLQQSIVDFLTSRGVASQSEVAERLEVSRQLAAYHLGALERLGTVDSRYWGRFKQYYIQEKDVISIID